MRYLLSISLITILAILPVAVTSLLTLPTCTRPDTTELAYRSDGDGLDKIYRALVTCPNITSLDLDFVWTGCVAPSVPFQFNFQNGNRFPALRKLSLSEYDFEDHWRQKPWFHNGPRLQDWISYWWHSPRQAFDYATGRSMIPPRTPPPSGTTNPALRDKHVADTVDSESNLDKWLQAMDFSQIEELHLAQEEKTPYTRLKNLTSLRHLSFDWGNSRPEVPEERVEFIRSVPPLESLSITIGPPYYYAEGIKNRTQFPLLTILETHGASLQSLSLKQREGQEAHLRRPMLSLTDLSAIQDSCPHLKHLSLDIDRNASTGWPNATFRAITQISSLDSLTLRFEIGADLHGRGEPGDYGWNPAGLDGAGPFREPRMSLEVAQKLFDDLWAKKVGEELRQVKFVVGDHEDKAYSGPLYFPSWEEGRDRMFVCEIANADQRNSSCTVEGDEDPYP